MGKVRMDRRQHVRGVQRPTPVVHTPLASAMKHLSDAQLLAKLLSYGIALDRPALAQLCEQHLDAGRVAQRLIGPTKFKGKSGQSDVHRIEDCVANLWQRWFPELPSFDRLEERMLAGHALLEHRDVAGACRIWLEGWDEVLALLERTGSTSLEQLDRQFSGGEFVLNWAEDLDRELWNAGLDDPQFLKTRIAHCEVALQRITTDDTFFTASRRHALAESYFELGEMDRADALYREWLSADPQWGWGWIRWANCYRFARPEMKNLDRAEQILLEGRTVDQVRNPDQLTEHLASLYRHQGRAQEAQLLGPTQPSHGTPRSGPKVGRNDPCPCGSGKKFKKCCGGATAAV